MGKASRRKRERRRITGGYDLPAIVTFELGPGVKSERVFSLDEGALISDAGLEHRVVDLLRARDFAAVDSLLAALRRAKGL